MILTVQKDKLVRDFLYPISHIIKNSPVRIFLSDNKMEVVCNDPSAKHTCFLYTSLDIKLEKGSEQLFNPILGDCKQFLDYVSIIKEDEISFELTDNSIKYVSKNVRFNYHLTDDIVLKNRNVILNPQAIHNFKYIVEGVVKKEDLNILTKMSTCTKNADKLYFYTKNSDLICELTNKTIPYSDDFTITLCNNCQGVIKNDIVINVSNLWNLSCIAHDKCVIKVSNNNCLIFDVTTDTSTIKLITPGLV